MLHYWLVCFSLLKPIVLPKTLDIPTEERKKNRKLKTEEAINESKKGERKQYRENDREKSGRGSSAERKAEGIDQEDVKDEIDGKKEKALNA